MSGIEKAVQRFDGQRGLAAALKVKPPTVHQWVKGIRPVPEKRCLEIERLTAGEIRCEEIRADVDWSQYQREWLDAHGDSVQQAAMA